MIFLEVKQTIKSTIVECYGSVQKFVDAHPEINKSRSAVAQELNPQRNTSLLSLKKYCDVLDLELIVKRKLKTPSISSLYRKKA